VTGIEEENVELITIENDAETTVSYATTSSIDIARNYGFDLVRVGKTLDSTTPTDSTYRQLFLCYLPKDKDGAALTASTADHDAIFSTTNHEYDLGTVLYLANKAPVYRKYLGEDETFVIMV